MTVAHKTTIAFSLVSIPVSLYTATQDTDIRFNQLCKQDHSRVRYKKVCSSCGSEVTSEDIVKGFEYEKDQYVVVTPDDFEKIKSPKDKTIQILQLPSSIKSARSTSIRPITPFPKQVPTKPLSCFGRL